MRLARWSIALPFAGIVYGHTSRRTPRAVEVVPAVSATIRDTSSRSSFGPSRAAFLQSLPISTGLRSEGKHGYSVLLMLEHYLLLPAMRAYGIQE